MPGRDHAADQGRGKFIRRNGGQGMEKIRVVEDIPLKLVPMTKNGLIGGFREVPGRAKV